MKLTKTQRIITIIGIVLVVMLGTGLPLFFYQKNNKLKVTYIHRAGIMLEYNFNRFYIDPLALIGDYSKKQADAIFITHSHEDHLSTYDIDKIYTDSTTIVCAASDTSLLAQYHSNLFPVNPMDEGVVEKISFQAFPMYTDNWVHPKENNWTGYILNFNDFTLFHAGDSANISEYSQLAGQIDVLFLPIYDSFNMMGPVEVNETIHRIKPKFMIPIHYLDDALEDFETHYVPYLTDTIYLRIQKGESYTFNLARETR